MAGVKYWIWLAQLKGLTGPAKQQLLDYFGSPESVYYADAEEYHLLEGMTGAQIAQLGDKSLEEANEIMGECQRLGLRILTMQDADYPARLRNIFDPPLLLYVKGTLPLMDEEAAVAVVGTRGASPYGIACAEKLSFGLAKQGAIVVSGAARGIDSSAHRGALRAGMPTVAVLGCGIDVVYPEENAWLYQDIAASGALVSEYPPGTPALGAHFPVRNRIISGLCLAALVIEAPERSGALITANTALEQGRDIFAVPGPIDAPNSRGCNRLIADGAGLVSESWDILREYAPRFPGKLSEGRVELPHRMGYQARVEQKENAEKKLREKQEQEREERVKKEGLPELRLREAGLTEDQETLLRALRDGAQQVDDLIARTEIPTRRALSALTMLELDGYVGQENGKLFSLKVKLVEE